MYFSVWMILLAVSLWVSLAAFWWGLQSGQFSDQDRARYLPLKPRSGIRPAGPWRSTF
jgi:cbb3-type cytochrome oxidase maturation protein